MFSTPKAFTKPTQGRIQRYTMVMQNFKTEVYYLKGDNNGVADALSREMTQAGDSLLDEKRIDQFVDNRLLVCNNSTSTFSEQLFQAGYKPRNNLTPEKVNRTLAENGEKAFTLIFMTQIQKDQIADTLHVKSQQTQIKSLDFQGSDDMQSDINLSEYEPPGIEISQATSGIKTTQCQSTQTPQTDIHDQSEITQVGNNTCAVCRTRNPRKTHEISPSDDTDNTVLDPPAHVTDDTDTQVPTRDTQAEDTDTHNDTSDLFTEGNTERTARVVPANIAEHVTAFVRQHDMVALQNQDTFIKAIKTFYLEDKLPKNKKLARKVAVISDDVCTHSDVFYKVKIGHNLAHRQPPRFQLLLPASLIPQVLRTAHQTTSHAALSSLMADLKDKYYWPSMLADCAAYIRSCPQCQVFKKDFITHKTNYFYTSTTFKMLSIDVAGPYKTTEDGYKYLLTVVDMATSFLIVAPLKDTTAKTICLELLKIYHQYSFPQIVMTDNAAYFVSKLNKALEQVLQYYHLTPPSHSAFILGRVERSHKTLHDRLKRVMESAPELDFSHLAYQVAFSMNAIPNARFHRSSFELVYGQQCSTPTNALTKQTIDTALLHRPFKELMYSLHDNLLYARERSQEYVQKMLRDQNRRVDKDAEVFTYLTPVYIYKPNANQQVRKLQSNWVGVYFITEKHETQNFYKIAKQLGGQSTRHWIAAQRIRRAYLPAIPPNEPDAEELLQINQTPDPNLELQNQEHMLKDFGDDSPQVRDPDTNFQVQAPISDDRQPILVKKARQVEQVPQVQSDTESLAPNSNTPLPQNNLGQPGTQDSDSNTVIYTHNDEDSDPSASEQHPQQVPSSRASSVAEKHRVMDTDDSSGNSITLPDITTYRNRRKRKRGHRERKQTSSPQLTHQGSDKENQENDSSSNKDPIPPPQRTRSFLPRQAKDINAFSEYRKNDILRMFGVIVDSHPKRYLIQLKTGEVIEVERSQLSSNYLKGRHGKTNPFIAQHEIKKIRNQYEF